MTTPVNDNEHTATELDGTSRVAVVTGGASGIGLAVVNMLLGAGAKVACLDRAADPQRRDDEARQDDERFMNHIVDVRQAGALASAREAVIQRWAPPDLIVISAGVYRSTPGDEEPLPLDELFDISARGVIYATRVFLADLLAAADAGRCADLVVVGAIAHEVEYTDSTVFGAAAAAVGQFTSGLRTEYQHRGLRISHIAPGYVDTPQTRPCGEDANTDAALFPADVAQVIGYALSQPKDVTIGEIVLVSTRQPWS